MRWLLVAVGVVAYLGLVVAVGKYLKRRTINPDPQPSLEKYTVLWRNWGNVSSSYTGTITYLDDDYLLISDDDNWPVVIDRRDVIEVYGQ